MIQRDRERNSERQREKFIEIKRDSVRERKQAIQREGERDKEIQREGDKEIQRAQQMTKKKSYRESKQDTDPIKICNLQKNEIMRSHPNSLDANYHSTSRYNPLCFLKIIKQ